MTQPEARKQFLRGAGRCFVCLKKGHVSAKCRSGVRCTKCIGPPHHVSICGRKKPGSSGRVEKGVRGQSTETNSSAPALNPEAPPFENAHAYTTLYTEGNGEVLLQTAQATIFNPEQPGKQVVAQLILDSGSHRSYVTERIRKSLCLKSMGKKLVSIATFGSEEPEERECHVVNLGIHLKDSATCELAMLTVPIICDNFVPVPVTLCLENYPHLNSFRSDDLAHHSLAGAPEVLIGSDHYWQLVTGTVVRGSDGPVAIQTKLGWVLTGPVSVSDGSQVLASMATFLLKTNSADGKS